MRFGDLDLLNQLQRLKDVGDVVKSSDSGLHDGIRQSNAMDDFGGNVQIDFSLSLKER